MWHRRGAHQDGKGEAFCTRLARSDRGRADGLDYAVNLVELDLLGNPVAHFARVASLSVGCAGIADVWPLRRLTGLQVLDLSGSAVTGLTPMEALHIDAGADRPALAGGRPILNCLSVRGEMEVR